MESLIEGKIINVNNKKSYLFTKRMIDIFGSIIGLILFSPIFIIVSIAIKIENPKDKVFFCQERIGMNEKVFTMYKFRSMVSNAEDLLKQVYSVEEIDGAVLRKKNDDPRITKVGKFIRKTSIDELPQLINILKGDMTFVGPRPPVRSEVVYYSDYEKQRLLVKQGLTGYWQIGGRSSVDFESRIALDLKYIQERNTFVDIKVILKTIFVLFGDKNAM